MQNKLLCVFFYSMLGAFGLPSLAAGFNVTTDFSRPATEDAGGGGGGSVGLSIFRIVAPEKSIGHVNNIYFGHSFIDDPVCDVSKIVISLNGMSYAIYAAANKYEHRDGFMSSYTSKNNEIAVSIQHVKTLRRTYDPDTECTTYDRLVKVVIKFKGEKKIVYGLTNGGCP